MQPELSVVELEYGSKKQNSGSDPGILLKLDRYKENDKV